MGGNAFYSNAEAYAFEILQQKLVKEAQKSAQQTIMELSALKSFLGQGQLLYCIPFGGVSMPNAYPFPFPTSTSGCVSFDSCYTPSLPPPCPNSNCTPASTSAGPPCSSSPCPQTACPQTGRPQQSVVHVNVKNAQSKIATNKPGSDECNIGKDGIDITIDMREFLPAEICLDVDEKFVEIKAHHVDSQGSKTFARRYDLPACILVETIKCVLSHDGFLIFSASWCRME